MVQAKKLDRSGFFVASPIVFCEQRTEALALLGGEEIQLVLLGIVAGQRLG
ncbi:hypothetical protein ABIG06_003053 [Bradyrhizobium sp. USDA 326]